MKLTPQSQLALRIGNDDFLVFWQDYFRAIESMAVEAAKVEDASTFSAAGDIGINFMGMYKEEMRRLQIWDGEKYDLFLDAEGYKKHLSWVQPNRNYLITGRAAALSEMVNIGASFDLKFLSKYADKRVTFMLGAYDMIRYQKRGNEILMSRLVTIPDYVTKISQQKFYGFRLVLDKNEVYYLDNGKEVMLPNPVNIKDSDSLGAGMIKVYLEQFLQLLIFTELGKIYTLTLRPGESKVLPGAVFKTKNESKCDVAIVNSNWNVNLKVTGEFAVRGHLRYQPCGKNREDRELIWIDEFKKHGYNRTAGVLLEQIKQNNNPNNPNT